MLGIASRGSCPHCGGKQKPKSKSSSSEWLNRHLGAWPCREYRDFVKRQQMTDETASPIMGGVSGCNSSFSAKRLRVEGKEQLLDQVSDYGGRAQNLRLFVDNGVAENEAGDGGDVFDRTSVDMVAELSANMHLAPLYAGNQHSCLS